MYNMYTLHMCVCLGMCGYIMCSDQTKIINNTLSSNSDIFLLNTFRGFSNYLKCVINEFHIYCAPVYTECYN